MILKALSHREKQHGLLALLRLIIKQPSYRHGDSSIFSDYYGPEDRISTFQPSQLRCPRGTPPGSIPHFLPAGCRPVLPTSCPNNNLLRHTSIVKKSLSLSTPLCLYLFKQRQTTGFRLTLRLFIVTRG